MITHYLVFQMEKGHDTPLGMIGDKVLVGHVLNHDTAKKSNTCVFMDYETGLIHTDSQEGMNQWLVQRFQSVQLEQK